MRPGIPKNQEKARGDAPSASGIRCREIASADLDAVADLLAQGFARRSRDYWINGLRRMSAREVPQGFPRYGYMLDHEGTPVGVLLLIYTSRDDRGGTSIRCNLSSWYVVPAYRNYAPMLTSVAQRHKHVTYVNISPAHWTWRIIEAQGFQAYCGGLFFSFPALSHPKQGVRIEIIRQDAEAVDDLSEVDAALLARHAACGCLSLVCRAADGRSIPFVLQPMRLRGLSVPAMRLIYCHDVADYVACAGIIGRFLLRRGRIMVALDANGRMKDLVGFYRGHRGRKYFKGPQRPRLADLSDSELVIYGP
ncbi:acyl-CoA acyltransferase [Bradyrhizobium jicamae]|uniref:acyl-CoA acyltransferase n=1 Tax=Bradyrhizobium jicamae TaxID=280332 RepID=UPI001BA8BCE4|nr:acyl-CoA acyltransferase [Bradyrhizobium jicamae]MBR0753281.1 acyl-CoA acyltransferase [Bradyrhizobium jicamae]